MKQTVLLTGMILSGAISICLFIMWLGPPKGNYYPPGMPLMWDTVHIDSAVKTYNDRYNVWYTQGGQQYVVLAVSQAELDSLKNMEP